MSSTNADLIAVSLTCPKDPKSPFRMGPPSYLVVSRDGSGPFFWPRVGFRVLRSSSGRVSG